MNTQAFWRKELAQFFFPRGVLCLGCNDPLRADARTCLCESCAQSLEALKLRENICPRCMTPLDEQGRCPFCSRKGMEGLREGYAAYRYTGLARYLIFCLKFYWQDEAAQALCDGMTRLVPLGEYDALTPVPLHEKRQRMRGANQAETLCRLLSPKVGLPVLVALKRTQNTQAQSKLSLVNRQKNVKGAFCATQSVEGLRILLVDDIRTTGATARECARELTKAGAASVGILTAALATKKETAQ